MKIKQHVISIFYLVISFTVSAQYINSDSLVVVQGKNEPELVKDFENELVTKLRFGSDHSATTGIMLGKFAFPHRNKIISRFGPRRGRMHYGTDIRMAHGDTVYAAFEGRVIRSRYYYGFGNLVVLQHDKKIKTYYAHLSRFLVKNGDWINRGEGIGLAGSTGRATGSHLHFEIRENDRAYDPELVYDFKKGEIRNDVESVNSLAHLQRRLIPKGYSVNEGVPQYYSVRSGDSLWRISRRFKMSIQHICRLNKISENAVLRIGQPLKLY